ncbi:MAG: hypothetical protein ACKO1O_08205 [Erythrobacter sp.]
MLRPPAHRPARSPARRAPAMRALALALPLVAAAAPLAAQQTFSLPPSSPAPTPTPAGPSDERAGVAIPPRAAGTAAPTAPPTAAPSPQVQPLAIPSATAAPQRTPAPRASAPSATTPSAADPALSAGPTAGAKGSAAPQPSAPVAPGAAPPLASTPADAGTPPASAWSLPVWWPFAAGGLGALLLLGAIAFVLGRHRKTRPLRLAAPGAGATAAADPATQEPPRIDLALEITAASRSLMMFTLEYRLTIANRSARAVGDLNTAMKLACARAGAAPSSGAAQGLASVDRIGPHQARSLTGTLQLPLSAIAPLRQGQTPLFVPLVHVTLEGEGLPAQVRSFVIGTPSASGRVHPIALDVPPGGIAGLVAQPVAIPPASAAA